jgi:glycosyltransferase involved in cell wall biosynthesis
MTDHRPAVTVIVPTYNSSGTLRLSLETVLRQDFSDFEVWVVGDGCSDDSETVVSSFGDKRVHWMNLPTNSGTPGMPRNEGLRRARGRFIAYLGHDDLWFPWHLSELVDCIEKSNSDFVYSLGVIIGPEGAVGTFTLPNKAWDLKAMLSPSNWLHRKSMIEVVGLWSPDVKVGNDHDFLQRVLATKMRLDFRRNVSVLKYPAPLWRMYSLASNFPQSSHVKALRHNAEELRLELLMELATVVSEQGLRLHYQRASRLPVQLRALIRWSFDLYGRKRWPLNHFLYWRWRRRTGLIGKKRMPK